MLLFNFISAVTVLHGYLLFSSATVLHGSLFFSAEGTYLGCFDAKKAELSGMMERVERNNMTASMCSDICGKGAYDKYGLQYGYRCYCGNQTEILESNDRAEGQCNNPCKGAPKCGGNQVIAVYNYTSYVGCYSYAPNESIDFGGKVEYLTPTICREKCNKYKFFGVTQGSKCYCRSVISNTQQTNDDDCNELTCQGGPTCGGSGYIAMWDFVNRTLKDSEINASTTVPPATEMSASTTVPSTTISLCSEDDKAVVSTVFLVLSFALGCLAVIGVSRLSRLYLSRKLVKDVRKLLKVSEFKRKLPSLDNRNYNLAQLHACPTAVPSDSREGVSIDFLSIGDDTERGHFTSELSTNVSENDYAIVSLDAAKENAMCQKMKENVKQYDLTFETSTKTSEIQSGITNTNMEYNIIYGKDMTSATLPSVIQSHTDNQMLSEYAPPAYHVTDAHKTKLYQKSQTKRKLDDVEAYAVPSPGLDVDTNAVTSPGFDIEAYAVSSPGYDVEANAVSSPGLDFEAYAVSSPGLDVEAHAVSSPGLDVEAYAVSSPGFDVKPNAVSSPRLDVEAYAVSTPGFDVNANAVSPPGFDVEAYAVSSPGLDVEAHAVSSPGFDFEANAVSSPGFDVKANAVSSPGLDVEAYAVSSPGLDVEAYAVSSPGFDVEAHAVSSPGFDAEAYVVSSTGFDVKANAFSSPGLDVEAYAVSSPGFDVEAHAVSSPSFDADAYAVSSPGIDVESYAVLSPDFDVET
ncbi:uncharacterized protein [Apostichopus japonicus]|uniref:uncharacterized protein isoform X4 n=1 Tax=Stichopus japonicus TaxID=307972 RepID=UPI003AB7339B